MRRILLLAFMSLSGLILLGSGQAGAQAIAQAYSTDAPLQRGMIVRLDPDDKSKVEALTAQANDKMEGVVVAANDAPVTLSDTDQSKRQVFVATSGRYYVLVSTQNGPIAVKDHITISSLAGIGMRAGTTDQLVVGRALESFDGTKNASGTTSIKDSSGGTASIALGLIEVDINITRNPGRGEEKTNAGIPGFAYLQSGASTIVGKEVSMAKVYLSCLVLILATAVAGSVLYSGVKNGLLAIGRNPLAKKSILGNLVQVVAVSIVILIFGTGAVYLILKL